jgi:tetratricopeptide (TPR) repeat protein
MSMPHEISGRNHRCPCGSGRKFKHCCARKGPSRSATDKTFHRREAGAPPHSALANLVALAAAGRYGDMEARAREMTVSHPTSGLAWKALGVALQMQDKEALDALERAARLLPNDVEAQSNFGTALRRRGRLEEAVVCLRGALQMRPGLAEVWNNLGNAERDLGHFEPAVAALREALRLKPEFAKAHNNLGNVLLDLGNLDEAVASYRQALVYNANYPEAYSNLGSALRLQGRSTEAQSHCARALTLDADFPAAITLLAQLRSDQGQFTEARTLLERVIAIDPKYAQAWAALAGLRRMSHEDSGWLAGAMRTAEGASPRDEITLRFAIGKYLDDVGNYGDAFENFRRANDLAKLHRPRHDQALLTAGVDRLIESHTAEWLDLRAASSIRSERPVLVVGMPRSGTTLAERILASHPQVHGAGELPYWNDAAGRYAAAGADVVSHSSAPVGGDAALSKLADDYLASLGEASHDAARVVDKMPANFMFLGMIHAALPLARIIHLERNPIDTCLSIYFQNFGPAHSYANDLEDLAHYYSQYRRMMSHWRRTLPETAILDVPYEKLVENPQVWSRAMIGHIGLAWDARCLDPHGSAGIVRTFSKWQVRQPIHTASVERWRHYEKFVGPLRGLGPPLR